MQHVQRDRRSPNASVVLRREPAAGRREGSAGASLDGLGQALAVEGRGERDRVEDRAVHRGLVTAAGEAKGLSLPTINNRV